jgi:hypothetical protein
MNWVQTPPVSFGSNLTFSFLLRLGLPSSILRACLHSANSVCFPYLQISDQASICLLVEASWNVMAHVQKPDFLFRRNGRVHLNQRGRQFSRLLAAEVCSSALIVGSNAGYNMFRGSVKSTGYPLQSPVSPSLPLPCVTVCHHISTGLYSTNRVIYMNGK